ncbi:MAG: SAM-dependent DNA methyltransferase, partial [Gammaproteobacteria bacterium]
KGKVQLINGVNLCGKMRKSLGSKRNEMSGDDIAIITRTFGAFEVVDATTLDQLGLDKPAEQKSNRGRQSEASKTEAPKTFASKIFPTHQFGYRRITIERPLRESYQFSDERIAELRFAPKPLNAAMKWIDETYGTDWQNHQEAIRKHIKNHFSEIKEAKIKELLNPKTWETQQAIFDKAKQLQQVISTEQCNDMNGFDEALKAACKKLGISLDTKEKKQITNAVSWKNPEAEKVIKKIHKNAKANPIYGLFDVNGQTIEYKPDGDLRDFENVTLDPSQSVNHLNETYFKKEVQPHVSDAWIDGNKKDEKDGEIGIVGYEIPFNRHFYQYVPPRPLEEIDKDLDKVSREIMDLLQEVHS